MRLGFTVCHRAMMTAMREAREASGLSGRALSVKLGEHYNYAHYLETGRRMPNYCDVMQYLNAIGADPVEFARRVVELTGHRGKRR